MSHPVDRPEAAEQDASTGTAEPKVSMEKPASSDVAAAPPEPRPRPSWGHPGPAATPAAAAAPAAAPYGQPVQPTYGQPTYGQPGYGQQGQPPYGPPGQPPYGPPPGPLPYGPQQGWPPQPAGTQFGAGQPGWQQQPGWAPPTPAQYGQDLGRQEERFAQFYGERPRTGLSVTAMIFGILTLLSCWAPYIGIPLGILAIGFGFFGLRRAGRGMAITGLALGGVGLVVAIIASILWSRFFVNYYDVISSCAERLDRTEGQAFERCVTSRSSEYNPFDELSLALDAGRR